MSYSTGGGGWANSGGSGIINTGGAGLVGRLFFLAAEDSSDRGMYDSSHGGSGEGGAADKADSSSSSGFAAFLLFLFNVGLVFGPHIGYVVQYLNIRETHNIDGYSPLVSVILLVSNTIRIFYFPGAVYAIALLLQAVMAIATHTLLLHKVLCVHHEQDREARENRVLDYLSGVSSLLPETPSPTKLSRPISNTSEKKSGNSGMLSAGGQHAVVVSEGGSGGAAAAAAATSSSYNIDLGAAAAGYQSLDTNRLGSGQGGATENYTGGDGEDRSGRGPLGSCWAGFLHLLYAVTDAMEAQFKTLEPQGFLYCYTIAGIVGFFSVLILFAITGFAKGLVEAVGYIALGIEATLVIPQILRNARRLSTEGLTVMLILTWVVGDAVKIVYFVLAKQPLPFILCGAFQLALDCVVVFQFFFYRWRSSTMNAMFPSAPGNGSDAYATV